MEEGVERIEILSTKKKIHLFPTKYFMRITRMTFTKPATFFVHLLV